MIRIIITAEGRSSYNIKNIIDTIRFGCGRLVLLLFY